MEIDIVKIVSFFNPFTTLVIIFFITILILALYIMNKMQTISFLRGQVNRLDNIVKDLDQQAKLIIKGDMELRLYQQEIEDKLNKFQILEFNYFILDTDSCLLTRLIHKFSYI